MNAPHKTLPSLRWLTLLLFVLASAVASPVGAAPGSHTAHAVLAQAEHAAVETVPDGHDHSASNADPDDSFFTNFMKVYTPRRVCMYDESPLIWLHILSDVLIALAYYSIPIALVTFVRKRADIVFGWVFWLFAAFILLCGTTHVMGVLNIWTPYYRLDGVLKAITAAVSVLTAVMLWRLIPKALAMPSRAGLEREVSERTQDLLASNEALRQSEERYRLVNKATNDVIWDWDIAAKTVLWSESLERTFGHKSSEVHPALDWWQQFLHPEDRARVIASLEAAVRERREAWSDEYRFRRADGAYASVVDRAHVSRDEAGNPTRMVGAMLDQTERQEAAAERERLLEAERKARADAEHANSLKDEFLATLSHELRTPLSAVLGWAQLLGNTRWTDPTLVEGLAVIDRNARAQLQLIEDLLDMSRIVSGKMQLEMANVSLVDVMNRAIETIRPAAFAKGIRLDVANAEPAQVRGDATRLQQVMWNLLSNAVKFTPAGGRVSIGVKVDADQAEVAVSDSGIGIEPEFLPHVFERFRQADGTTTRRFSGLGLGLSIVKSIVEAHGGTAYVQSEGPGRGATFVLELPLSGKAEPRPPSVQVPSEARSAMNPSVAGAVRSEKLLEGLTVLIVDDERDVRELVQRTLAQFQARTIGAGSAAEALELIRQHKPDVALIDIGMPGADGYDLIRQIRQLRPEEGSTIPAAALTAFARPEDRSRALLAGFKLHITKPVSPMDLMASVASLASRHG